MRTSYDKSLGHLMFGAHTSRVTPTKPYVRGVLRSYIGTEWVSRRHLVRRFRGFSASMMDEAIQDMAAEGLIDLEIVTPDKGGRTTWRARLAP